jgi:hypothetical protein
VTALERQLLEGYSQKIPEGAAEGACVQVGLHGSERLGCCGHGLAVEAPVQVRNESEDTVGLALVLGPLLEDDL